MNIVVVYDSVFGNTEKAAETIAHEINATIFNINEPKLLDVKNVDFLIVGSPTHGGRSTTEMHKFLDSLSAIKGMRFAAFDTRSNIKFVKIFGFAADRMALILREKGGAIVDEPTGFFVSKKEGPLLDSEIDRVRSWANNLLNKLS